jgi:hypothetical protein
MSIGTDFELEASAFTELFVEQLVRMITAIPSHRSGGLASDGIDDVLLSRVEGGRDSVQAVRACLAAMRLITEIDSIVGRSTSGDKVRREMREHGSSPVALAIIRSGLMAEQVRAIRAILRRHGNGYACGRSAVQAIAPQLFGLLSRMPDVEVSGKIVIGRDAALEIDSVWNELPLTSRINWQDAEKRKKAIGDRAELYSLQFERTAHVGAWEKIIWISRDDDSLGYDIEVPENPIRRIEVKGSAGRDVLFFLSSNEYRVAQRYGTSYEIHFWGEIDIKCDPVEEFERLRSAGYPIRVSDPTYALTQEPWLIEPHQYRVTCSNKTRLL